jgi:HrpA-like RNA helicase
MDTNPLHNYQFVDKPRKVAWNPVISSQFENLIQSSSAKTYLSGFEWHSVSDQVTLDGAVRSLSGFLVNAAVQAAGPAVVRARPSVPRRSYARNWKFRKTCLQSSRPKWQDNHCESVRRQMRLTSRLLKQQPGNQYLKGKLMSESKQYNKLWKQKQKQFVDNMFTELDQLHASNPKAYMDLVKSMRDGTFDKSMPDPTSHVSPEKWREHFQGLLGPHIQLSPSEEVLSKNVRDNCDVLKSE